MPKISVMMPVYNAERYVGEAIESILRQTFADFEFLILNDGSTDGSAEILWRYAQRDQRIRLHDFKENAGLIARLNQGIDLAQGEYLARMDADDISLPERFALQAQFLDARPEVAVVGCAGDYIDANGVATVPYHWHYGGGANLYAILTGRNPVGHPFVMYRTKCIKRIGGYHEVLYAEDLDLWFRLYLAGEQCDNLTENLFRYRVHAAQVSTAARESQHRNHCVLFRDFYHQVVTPKHDRADTDEYLEVVFWMTQPLTNENLLRVASIFHALCRSIRQPHACKTGAKALFYRQHIRRALSRLHFWRLLRLFWMFADVPAYRKMLKTTVLQVIRERERRIFRLR